MLQTPETLSALCRMCSILDYRVDMHIGLLDHERGHTQPVIFTIDVWSDPRAFYDYCAIVQAIEEVACGAHIDLQETVHERILERLLANPTVCAARIRTVKTDAFAHAAGASVQTFRMNPLARLPCA